MNEKTTAFYWAAQLDLDLVKMPCMDVPGVRPAQKCVLGPEPLKSLIVESDAAGKQDWLQLQNFLYLQLWSATST